MSKRLFNPRTGDKYELGKDTIGVYLALTNNAVTIFKEYQLMTALAHDGAATGVTAGSFARTRHPTGAGKLFKAVLDTTIKWKEQNAVVVPVAADNVADPSAVTQEDLTDNSTGAVTNIIPDLKNTLTVSLTGLDAPTAAAVEAQFTLFANAIASLTQELAHVKVDNGNTREFALDMRDSLVAIGAMEDAP